MTLWVKIYYSTAGGEEGQCFLLPVKKMFYNLLVLDLIDLTFFPEGQG